MPEIVGLHELGPLEKSSAMQVHLSARAVCQISLIAEMVIRLVLDLYFLRFYRALLYKTQVSVENLGNDYFCAPREPVPYFDHPVVLSTQTLPDFSSLS